MSVFLFGGSGFFGTPVLESIEEEEEDVVVKEPEHPAEPITRKDPKRVEQGKRLAQISLEAKRKKMREQIEKENFSYLTTYGYPLITFASVLGVAWMMVFGNSMVKPEDVVVPEEVLRPVTKKGASRKDGDRKSNFESLG